MSVESELTALANAVRSKTSSTAQLSISAMTAAVSSIETAAASKIIIRKLIDRDSLTEFEFPAGLTRIGPHAFAGCASLELAAIPRGISIISDWAFSGCYGLSASSIPLGVSKIGEYAFNDCTGLTDIHLPNSIVTMGAHAFFGCVNLASVSVAVGYNANLPLENCKLISENCIAEVIENYANNGQTGKTRTINLHPVVYARLSDEVLQSASSKGITITG